MTLGAIFASISALLSALLGIIALQGDYRDQETGHIIKWGRLNLAGIIRDRVNFCWRHDCC